jgi:hypothetical protein
VNVTIENYNGLYGMTRGREKRAHAVFKTLLHHTRGREDEIRKVTTQGLTTGSGLVYYDLQAGAKLLYPILTPWRNEIPRVKGKGGTATHWLSVTGVNTANTDIGVSEGNRNAVMSTTTQPYMATYGTIGLENNITYEEDESAENFDDAKALGSRNLLQATMQWEEYAIVGGNASVPLGKTPTPVLAGSTTGGTLPAATYSVICVAQSYDGWRTGSVANGVRSKITRTNADSSVDCYGGGSAPNSTNATVTTTGSTGSIGATVANVANAVAYAWFWGAVGSEKLGAITTINSCLITAVATGSQLASSLDQTADWSTNALLFDGVMTQINYPNSGSLVNYQATGTAGVGTPLTSDGAGGIVEINADLKAFWDSYRISIDEIGVSSQELVNITDKVIAAGGTPLFRFNIDAQKGQPEDVTVTAGAIVGAYLNKFSLEGGKLIPVRLHPNIPPGTIVYRKKTNPYPQSNVSNICEIRYLRDYYQIAWPPRTRKYEYGIYSRQVMPIYFLPGFGMRTNIANG